MPTDRPTSSPFRYDAREGWRSSLEATWLLNHSSPRDTPSEFDEIGVPEPFPVVENRNDLRGNSDQEDTFLTGHCVSQDLWKLVEHKLAHAIDLFWVGHRCRLPAHG